MRLEKLPFAEESPQVTMWQDAVSRMRRNAGKCIQEYKMPVLCENTHHCYRSKSKHASGKLVRRRAGHYMHLHEESARRSLS